MKAKVWADCMLTLLIPLLAGVVLLAGLSISERLIQHGWQTTLVFSDVIGLAAALIGVLTWVWWLLAIIGAFLATLLSKMGSYRAAGIVSALSPAFMRRMAAGVLGLELAAAGVLGGAAVMFAPAPVFAAVAAADTTDPSFQLSEPSSPTSSTAPSPTTPAMPSPSTTPLPVPAPSTLPAPSWTPQSSPSASAVNPGWTPQPPATDVDVVAAPAHRALSSKESKESQAPVQPGQQPSSAPPEQASTPANTNTNADGTHQVVVKRGDSLWTIAAAALGPLATDVEISQAWPQWYHANFSTIGNDPSLLLPGQVLRAPHA